MKMTKSEFKSLMKECLSELIEDGVFDKRIQQITESRSASPSHMLFGNDKSPKQVQNTSTVAGINPKILETVKNVTSAQPPGRKNMFEEIMLDTALTTLQRQLGGGDGSFTGSAGLFNDGPVDSASMAQDQAELSALSGGNPSRWATAAFGHKKK